MKHTHTLKAVLFSGLASICSFAVIAETNTDMKDWIGTEESWLEAGKATVDQKVAQKINTKRAKNVILFIGDGMGISTLTAGRILEGQLAGNPGEENYLSFEKFPYSALVKTYNVDSQVADSAGTATAFNTGAKTRLGVINTVPTLDRSHCDDIEHNKLTPIAAYAERAGLSTGVVSTARLTHATPAAVYANSPDRDWEADTDVPAEAKTAGCTDIASQIIETMGGNGLEVALGGGRANFLPKGTMDGKRADGKNIVKDWQSAFAGSAFVTNKAELENIDYTKTQHLLGLFSPSHMDYDDRRSADQPELAEMAESAIKMLSKNENGYFLMVEAGRIDHGHHEGNAHKALYDTVALSKAVRRTLELVDTEETLILVTADHSHTFTIAGYARRGNPIFGLVSPAALPEGELQKALDGKPYTTLGYANGPGAVKGERSELTDAETQNKDFKQQSLMPLHSETHGGEDVGLFAIGPWSHLATGTIEQNVIFHIMDHALDLRNRAK
ncbi:alkaline phosphatase [Kordiimonas pumila]|uniref:Alkaline phosphatase n=1 Tax=Kordiimonas pumila TaxID=2161677 RepID=A0ABV7D3F8_9PROT|nr:alkaline phosphatase [Kordiimonas pumila]